MTALTRQDAVARLESAGLHATDRRVRVLRAVAETPGPSSAAEVLESVRAASGINRVTVYRILDLLVEHHVLHRLDIGETPRRFCLCEDDENGHPHFHCMRCDRRLCLRHGPDILNPGALEALGLDIRHVDIRLEGFCPACRRDDN